MSIPVTEIISYSIKWNSVDPEDALRYLAKMYIDNCGVSTGLRSFADYCSVFWIERLKHNENKTVSPKYGDAETLPQLLPFLSDEYTEEIDDYDIPFMADVELRDILIEELREASDEKIKIILCAGICDFLPQISNDRWLDSYKMEQIEDAIVNLKNETLINYRHYKKVAKYIPQLKYSAKKETPESKIYKPPHPFTEDELRHFALLNKRLVELQRDVMEQMRDITLNLQEQIAKGMHQYDSFNVEGLIFIDDIEDDVDSLLNVLSEHAKYTVISTNASSTEEQMNERIADDIHWFGNWSGIFHQLDINHGLKVCRAFCKMFEAAEVFIIADIMKITPDMLFSQVKINI